MFNLKNKPLATGYFTKKYFSLLTVAIIGYLLTPAASAGPNTEYCHGSDSNMHLLPDLVLTVDRSGALGTPQTVLTADAKYEISCSSSLPTSAQKLHYEMRLYAGWPVAGYDDLYQTEVDGIGVRYSFEPSPHCTPDPFDPLRGHCNLVGIKDNKRYLSPKVSLVQYDKVQGSPEGPVITDDLVRLYAKIDNDVEYWMGSMPFKYQNFKYKRYGCTMNTPSVKLSFGTVQASKFSGVKSTSQPSTADKIYLNCDPDTSYFLTIQGKSVASHPDILELDQTSGHASGIGVQLEAGDSSKDYQNMKLNEETYMHKTDDNGLTTDRHIDIRARYFQTENKITPGTANASATFTITYQ
ncbi:hypothetical protein AXW45_04400 [Yersinia ruckeri]|uniref:fimbrial protein n=1 Tax=Yersinia ruckeri TaxID=29486 RepID=UPI0008FE158F|nr:fimbrial protein [Yersinia ruckeri]OJC83759.1 hypothetical protein AXW45_04400 [Yersinia ruckeri]